MSTDISTPLDGAGPLPSASVATTADDPPPILKPVTMRDRIVSIDILRGVAVLGILAMNIYAFSMPWAAYTNPLEWGGDDALNLGTWYFTHFLFDQKFMSIFSMLFGAGLILMWERAGRRPIGRIWYRRQFWLLLIGAVHGYLIWFGDILFTYAAIGMLVYLVRRWPAKRLLVVGALWILPALLLGSGSAFWQSQMLETATTAEAKLAAGEALAEDERAILDEYNANREWMNPTEAMIAEQARVHREGSYAEIVQSRVIFVAMMQSAFLFFFGVWRVGGMMMIGMALMKMDVFSASRSDGFYRRMIAFGYGIGFPLVAVSAWRLTVHDWDAVYLQMIGGYWNYFASIAIALGHIGLVMLAVRRGWLRSFLERLSAVGRMAFTNYLMQSILCTTLFYGYGFGLFGSLERWQQVFVVVPVVWALQIAYSPWWLARFRFGPAEWLWRALTYGNLPPMKREKPLPATA